MADTEKGSTTLTLKQGAWLTIFAALGIGTIAISGYTVFALGELALPEAEYRWEHLSGFEKFCTGAGAAFSTVLLWRALNTPVYRSSTTFFN
jgi:hypothetical protein